MRPDDASPGPVPDAPQGSSADPHGNPSVQYGSHNELFERDPTVAEVGEAGIFARILPRTKAPASAIVPTGDDAAVVAAPDGRYVITTDMIVEGPDFRRNWQHPYDLGWKACASNLADIAAMGARPTAVVTGLAVPDDTPMSWIEAFSEGMAAGLDTMAPGAGVVGGDMSSSPRVVVTVTAFGDLEGRSPVLRSGARAGDVVALAGLPGRSVAGVAAFFAAERAGREELMRIRDRGVESANAGREGPESVGGSAGSAGADGERDSAEGSASTADEAALDAVLRAHLAPTPPIGAGVVAADGGATAMMDVSDGLLLDASRMASASGVVIDLDSSAFADDVAVLSVVPGPDGQSVGPEVALEWCLTGGEDHPLLATFPAGVELPQPFRAIGRVSPRETAPNAQSTLVRVDGVARSPVGWDPYRH